MEENNYRNEFKFVLRQGNVLLVEKVFNADSYSPLTRSFIDVREILPEIIHRLQSVLSRSTYETNVLGVDVFRYQLDEINSFPKEFRRDLMYRPKSITQHIDKKTIRGVECKLGLYINDNLIVEREFYVDNFNPVARWSMDVVDEVNYAVEMIEFNIRKKDINNIWDDYDLINGRGFNISQIRELSPQTRRKLLSEIHSN